jgi:drug/metabolite transporter (DMT)-like permease
MGRLSVPAIAQGYAYSHCVLTATLLALAAAVLHAGWNLWVKQSGDRWIAIWGQMTMGGVIALVLVAGVGLTHGIHHIAWWQAIATGLTHAFYITFLARAYTLGDFSVTYPIARGGGALIAAIGGVLFLHDHLSAGMVAGILIAVCGIFMLAGRADNQHVLAALAVSATIGLYSTIDSSGSRSMGGDMYAVLIYIPVALFITAYGLVSGRGKSMIPALRLNWWRFTVAGAASMLTYWMVLIAVQKAAVGYVTALRESSVVIVALVGTRYLKEGDARRRVMAACIVLVGLATLVVFK